MRSAADPRFQRNLSELWEQPWDAVIYKEPIDGSAFPFMVGDLRLAIARTLRATPAKYRLMKRFALPAGGVIEAYAAP